MPPRKSSWTKAYSGVTHLHRRPCVASEVIPPRCWFCEPRPRKLVMSSQPTDPSCKCNPAQSGVKPGCSCHQSQDCSCCPNISCDDQTQPCNETKPNTRLFFNSALASQELKESEHEYPCKTCPAAAAKLARNQEGSLPVISCSEYCMKDDQPDQLFQDSRNSNNIQTDSIIEAPCACSTPNKQTSTSNVVPDSVKSCKSANMQYEKQCSDACLVKIATSTSCENWTELVRDLVKENLESLLDTDCEYNCSTRKVSSRRDSKDVPAATNSIRTCDQATFVTEARAESKSSLKAAEPPQGISSGKVCTADCQLGPVCNCRYPPAYKQLGCTGLITGSCECGKRS